MCSKVLSASLRTACMATLANMPSRTCTSSDMATRVSAVEQGGQHRRADQPRERLLGRNGAAGGRHQRVRRPLEGERHGDGDELGHQHQHQRKRRRSPAGRADPTARRRARAPCSTRSWSEPRPMRRGPRPGAPRPAARFKRCMGLGFRPRRGACRRALRAPHAHRRQVDPLAGVDPVRRCECGGGWRRGCACSASRRRSGARRWPTACRRA